MKVTNIYYLKKKKKIGNEGVVSCVRVVKIVEALLRNLESLGFWESNGQLGQRPGSLALLLIVLIDCFLCICFHFVIFLLCYETHGWKIYAQKLSGLFIYMKCNMTKTCCQKENTAVRCFITIWV
jgi:hypothetical protein